jgi:hypothetical protein
MQQYVHPQHFKAMQESVGPARAEAWRVKNNLVVGMPPEEEAMYEIDAETPDETVVDETVDVVPSAGGLGAPASYSAYQAAQKRVDDQIKANIDLLTAGRDALRNRRVGPSDSEKWFAIAAALGKPTRTGSFGEGLSNLNEALLEQNAARRKEREAQEALLEKYGLQIGGEQLRMLTSAANQAGQVYRTEAAAAAAARKAAQPTFELDALGNIKEVPKTVATPKTKEEFDALQVGTFYKIPAGPDAGKIVQKTVSSKVGG